MDRQYADTKVTDPHALAERAAAALRADPHVRTLAELAAPRDRPVYVVGGYLRDAALGRIAPDVDFVLRDALRLAREFADLAGGAFIVLHDQEDAGRQLVQARVVVRGLRGSDATYDFAELFGPTIETDLARRDFSCNAIALPLPFGETSAPSLYDPLGGLNDIASHTLRIVSPDAVERDPLRILRAFRLAATLRLEIEPGTLETLKASAARAAEPAPERTQAELIKLMAAPRSAAAVQLMSKSGVLSAIFTELAPARGVPQPRFHHLDVFDHSVATHAAIETVLAELPAWLGKWAPAAREYVETQDRLPLLKLAALLHDVGKPAVRAELPDGRVQFHQHDTHGADLAAEAARRLRFSRRQVAAIRTLVQHHMRPLHLVNAERRGALTSRAARRFRRDCGPHAVGVLLLAFADAEATRGPEMPGDAEDRLRAVARRLMARWEEDDRRTVAAPRLLTGHDVMDEFGVPQGPMLGELLQAVEEAQMDGLVSTREEALAFVRRRFAGRRNGGQ